MSLFPSPKRRFKPLGFENKPAPAPPPGYAYGPTYSVSWPNRLRAVFYILLGRTRSLGRDAERVVADMPVRPLARGAENIPSGGPVVVIANHYQREGLWMAWPAMFVANLVLDRTGADLHWIAIEEWIDFSLFGLPVPPVATRLAFERAYATYGILSMPHAGGSPLQPARSVRRAVEMVKRGQNIGLMPEGDVGATPELLPAREGVGTFLLLLASAGARILPLGLFEENGHLLANFGQALELKVPPHLPREDRDQWASDRVMLAVRNLLPQSLWGVYRDAPAEVGD